MTAAGRAVKTALLELTVSKQQEVVYSVRVDGAPVGVAGPPLSDAVALNARLIELEYADAEERARVVRRAARSLQPPRLSAWIRQWIADCDHDSVLCVLAKDDRLAALPWRELLSSSFAEAERAWVVHVGSKQGSVPAAAPARPRMLLAGWATSGAGFSMPGVERELKDFSRKVGPQRWDVQQLAEATSAQLLDACRQRGTVFVHLSPPGLARGLANDLALPVAVPADAPASAEGFDTLPLKDLNRALKANGDLRMVVVNACSAAEGCRQISSELGVVAIGWPAVVMDDAAADFTFYFYQRLMEGLTPVEAVRSFAQTVGVARVAVTVPLVWLPSPEWAEWRPFGPASQASPEPARAASGPAPAKTRARAGKRAPGLVPETRPAPAAAASTVAPPSGERAAASLDRRSSLPLLEFRPRAAINPALLVNNVAPIEHLNVDSPDQRQVHLRIECDTGAGVSVYRETVQLKMGVNPVTTTAIHFPALHELVQRRAGRRRVSFTAILTSAEGLEIDGQTRTALWMSAREWLDQQDTWAFIPAFVNPFDDGVLKVFDHAKSVLRTLGSPSDSFEGYLRGDAPDYVTMQMKAIFQSLRDEASGLTYITPPGSGVFDPSSKGACGQVVRTHGEVVAHRLGTCHDLALLIAACAEYVNIRPLVLLVPGHTFVGYWRTPAAQEEYWKKREGTLITGRVGEGWTITEEAALHRLVENGDIALIEATYVCERNKTFAEACERGAAILRNSSMRLDVAVDVYAARREVQPV